MSCRGRALISFTLPEKSTRWNLLFVYRMSLPFWRASRVLQSSSNGWDIIFSSWGWNHVSSRELSHRNDVIISSRDISASEKDEVISHQLRWRGNDELVSFPLSWALNRLSDLTARNFSTGARWIHITSCHLTRTQPRRTMKSSYLSDISESLKYIHFWSLKSSDQVEKNGKFLEKLHTTTRSYLILIGQSHEFNGHSNNRE
jgi:hypothetical protein